VHGQIPTFRLRVTKDTPEAWIGAPVRRCAGAPVRRCAGAPVRRGRLCASAPKATADGRGSRRWL